MPTCSRKPKRKGAECAVYRPRYPPRLLRDRDQRERSRSLCREGRDTPGRARGSRAELGPDDQVALEATSNALPIARILEQRVQRVVVATRRDLEAIARAKTKTDRVDARMLALLVAVGAVPPVGALPVWVIWSWLSDRGRGGSGRPGVGVDADGLVAIVVGEGRLPASVRLGRG